MSKIIFLFIFMFSLTAGAQKLKESKVPEVVLKNFKKEYPDLTVKSWEKEGALYEAEVKGEGPGRTYLYDAKGQFVAIEEEMSVAEVPSAIMNYLMKNFPGMVAQEYTRVVKADGTATYEADINNEDLLFDGSGNFTGKETEPENKKD